MLFYFYFFSRQWDSLYAFLSNQDSLHLNLTTPHLSHAKKSFLPIIETNKTLEITIFNNNSRTIGTQTIQDLVTNQSSFFDISDLIKILKGESSR